MWCSAGVLLSAPPAPVAPGACAVVVSVELVIDAVGSSPEDAVDAAVVPGLWPDDDAAPPLPGPLPPPPLSPELVDVPLFVAAEVECDDLPAVPPTAPPTTAPMTTIAPMSMAMSHLRCLYHGRGAAGAAYPGAA